MYDKVGEGDVVYVGVSCHLCKVQDRNRHSYDDSPSVVYGTKVPYKGKP